MNLDGSLLDFIKSVGAIYTYSGTNNPDVQRIYDECVRLESIGELERVGGMDWPGVVAWRSAQEVVK